MTVSADEPRSNDAVGVNVPRGVPGQRGAPEHAQGARQDGGLRDGDTGLGRPVPVVPSDELSPEEAGAMRERLEQEEVEAESALADDGITLPRFLFNATFLLAVLALGSLLALFVLAQTTLLLDRLEAAPAPLRLAGQAAVAVLLAVLGVAALRLAWLWFRLRRTRQVRLAATTALADRRGLRRLAHSRLEDAADGLKRLVAGYPLEGAKATRRLQVMGFTNEEVAQLVRHRTSLLDADRDPGPADWLRAFGAGFQEVLDTAARRRIGRAATLVAVKTALTPRTVDTVVVLHTALRLVADLARIYQLRLSGMGTAVVLGRAFTLAYLSSYVQDATEQLTRDAASHGIAQLLEGLPEGLSQAGSRIAGIVAPKAAEGAANGIMVYRLGTATMRLLRPVAGMRSP